MIKLYGAPRTSAGRCYFLLEELGVDYEAAPLDMKAREHQSSEFLKLNPNGKVPCLIDDDFVIWESLAINQYLAEKYKPELLGSTPQEKGRIQQWSIWSLVELQTPMVDVIIQTLFMPEEKRDHGVIDRAMKRIPVALQILDDHMEGRTYIAGEKITLGDFNVASIVNIANTVKVPLTPFPNISQWMARMTERPSFKKYFQLRNN
jgi:glutathione S-transferase